MYREGTVPVLRKDRISLAEVVEAVRLRDWMIRRFAATTREFQRLRVVIVILCQVDQQGKHTLTNLNKRKNCTISYRDEIILRFLKIGAPFDWLQSHIIIECRQLRAISELQLLPIVTIARRCSCVNYNKGLSSDLSPIAASPVAFSGADG